VGRAWCQPISVRRTPTTARKDTRLWLSPRCRARFYELLWAAGCASLLGCDRHDDPAPAPDNLPVAASSGSAAVSFDTPPGALEAELPRAAVSPGNDVPAVQHSGTRASVRIQRAEYYPELDAARIVLHASAAARFHVGRLPGEGKIAPIYLDIDDAESDVTSVQALGGIVERALFARTPRGVRLRLELTAEAEQNVFFLPAPFRVVVDVARSVLTQPSARTRSSVERIALDAGHGGSDPGAVGPTGVREKDVALDIAHRAAPLLARELRVSTLLTRDRDVFVPLEQRVAKANAFRADLFLSIHCNADPSNSGRGVMAFVLNGSENAAARHIAARENLVPAQPRDMRGFLDQFGDGEVARRSLALARLLQRASQASLAQGYPGSIDGGVHGAGFYVLAGARMPAVLFEVSFISNSLEEARLNTGRYRQKLADAIVNAVKAYRAGY
jgi:N-acetylmuramoyl-L-alanine amidase